MTEMGVAMRVRAMVLGTLLVIGVVGASSVALAAHYGTVCKHFNGPDGPKYVQQAKVCATIDDHDLDDKIRGWVTYHNAGTQRVTVHVSYVHMLTFYKNGAWIVESLGSFTHTVAPDDDYLVATPWRENPNGTYWTRTRMWVCWPDLRGKPCGDPVAWNSQQVSYP